MREIGLNFDLAAVREVAKLDLFLALGSFEKDKFGAPRGLVTPNLLEPENFLVEANAFLQVVQPIAGMEQLEGESHGFILAEAWCRAMSQDSPMVRSPRSPSHVPTSPRRRSNMDAC